MAIRSILFRYLQYSINRLLTSFTILFTNGWHLAARAADLKRAGLDSIYVSIDAADRYRHDTFRG